MIDFQILYLDNNRFIADQAKLRLEWKGYLVTTLDSEADLIFELNQKPYNLLIIDFQTLAPNTFALLERLKRQKIMPPTIIVNEDKDYRLVTKAMHLGCIDYVIKKADFQNYCDHLSLSVFQVFDNLENPEAPAQASQTSQDMPSPAATVAKWEYIPSEDRVNWFLSENANNLTMPYDEFTAKVHLEDLAHVKTQNNICLFSQQPVNYSFRYLSDDNRVTTYDIRLKAEVDHLGVVSRLYGETQAVSSQQLSDLNLRLKLSFLDNTADAVFITDAHDRFISVNKAFSSICGYSEQEILHKKSSLLFTDQFDTEFYKTVANKLKTSHFWQGEVSIRHKDGHSIPVWQSISILKEGPGHISQSISVLRDISQQKAYEESIKHQASYDPLTQLPNRSLFLDRLANAIKLSKRNNSKLALMLLDLDKFKWINDNLGHHAGDILLQATAERLQTAVRNSDTVARLGGDEFSIIVPELEKATDAELIARKIFNTFKHPVLIDQQEVFISGSIGITIFPDDGNDIDRLLKNSDSAMYMAKNKGHNSYYYYTHSLQQETEKRLKLISDMHTAMHNQEFSLHYQPIMDIVTQKVTSAETLLRWNQPQSGYIPLSDFIPVAEECGLIREIGNWVVEEVASNLQRWTALGIQPIQISLNQSVAQYKLSECHIKWLEILKRKHISPHCITFEISEKIFIEEKDIYLKSIEKLKQEGIQISLDGFGTGYSSLSYLNKNSVDVIKIDRSYTHSMLDDPAHAILVETIISLANKLGIKVIATGIENQQQLSLLNRQCRYVQGYYFSKPLPLKEFEEFIKIRNGS